MKLLSLLSVLPLLTATVLATEDSTTGPTVAAGSNVPQPNAVPSSNDTKETKVPSNGVTLDLAPGTPPAKVRLLRAQKDGLTMDFYDAETPDGIDKLEWAGHNLELPRKGVKIVSVFGEGDITFIHIYGEGESNRILYIKRGGTFTKSQTTIADKDADKDVADLFKRFQVAFGNIDENSFDNLTIIGSAFQTSAIAPVLGLIILCIASA